MISSETAVQRYLAGTASSQAKQKYTEGIDSVTESPMAKAASPAAEALYLQRTQESVTSGRRREKLMSVPLSRWKDNAKGKGAERFAAGCRASADKVRNHFQKFGPVYAQVSAECAAMPSGGTEEAVAKVRHAIETMKRAAGKI